MCSFFESFLKAAGYVFDGSLKISEDKFVFQASPITGQAGCDTIFLGDSQPAMSFVNSGMVGGSFNEVITF